MNRVQRERKKDFEKSYIMPKTQSKSKDLTSASAGGGKGFDLSAKKKCWLSLFKNEKYIHFRDNYNSKTFSLTINETKQLVRKLPKIERYLDRLELEELKTKKQNSDHSSSSSESE